MDGIELGDVALSEPTAALLRDIGAFASVPSDDEAVNTTSLTPDDDDAVYECEFDDDIRVFVRANELPSIYRVDRTAGARGIRGITRLAVRRIRRVLGGWLPDAVVRLRRGLPTALAERVGGAAGRYVAPWLAATLEYRRIPDPGLRRWQRNGALEPVERHLPADDQPWLVFLHGTGSSTLGSFGDLLAREVEWAGLQARYPGRVLALEHHTLTACPLENALALARALPDQARLHLVSFSRGGLVGELLARGQPADEAPPFDVLDRALLAGRSRQQAVLAELGGMLANKRFTIDRHVRVACPTLGTTLLAERADRWLDLVRNVVGRTIRLFGGTALAFAFDLTTSMALALTKERTNPTSLPGLEAMLPDGPIVSLVNREDRPSRAHLAVLSGDTERGGTWQTLKTALADRYYGEDHDLVVNTSAMGGGVARAGSLGRCLLDRGPEVSHFRYFANDRTAGFVIGELSSSNAIDRQL